MLPPKLTPGQRASLAPVPGQPPPWMVLARAFTGLRETPGPSTTPAIRNMLASLHAWWNDDGTPWCGTFLAYCMEDAGLVIPKAWYRAKEWATWGRPVDIKDRYTMEGAPYGAVVVLKLATGFHVTTYVAPVRSLPGMFWGFGGNQGDMVKASAFHGAAVQAVRWPADYPLTDYRGADVTSIANGQPTKTEGTR